MTFQNELSMAAGRFRQLGLLLWKNWLFSIRSWKSTLLQLFAPCFFLVLATGVSYLPQGLENVPDPPSQSIGTLPQCNAWNHLECNSLVVIIPELLDVNSTCVNLLMDDFSKATGLKNNSDIKIYTIRLLNQAVIENLGKAFASNKTQVGLLFFKCDMNKRAPNLNYTILFNSSRALKLQQLVFGSPNKPDGRVELAMMLDQIFMSHVLSKPVNISVNVSTFPRFFQQESIQSKQTISATLFIFCAITIQFVMLVYNVVSEKDLKLRQGLKLVGLKDSIYWFSWAITGIIIAIISTVVLMATGYACQLQFFFNTDFLINFFLFSTYSISMVPLAFFTSVFISTARAAVISGIVIYVVGMMVIMLLGNPFFLTELYENIMPLVYVLSLLPPFHLAKAMSDIGSSASSTDMSGLPHSPERFEWNSLVKKWPVMTFDLMAAANSSSSSSGSHVFYMPPTIYSFGGLLFNAVLYGVLSWYLDAVLVGNHGISRKWYFCFLPSYWCDCIPYYSKRNNFPSRVRPSTDTVQASDTDDQSNETAGLLNADLGYGSRDAHALRIQEFRKSFEKLCSCKDGVVKPAVDGLSLTADEHQILALLGHNGAGKTTTINMLIGLLKPDHGDAYFYDLSVCKELDTIRSFLGVCPQHDVLWGDLTAMEHMKLFGHLRGIPSEIMENEIATLLTEVQLAKVANNRVKTYSGGMKRRLSVALSFLGDPKVLFLDEPTTGMDPKIRRDIWNLILRMKENRVTIMTTHSMEEADILGDQIAIMANGQLKVMGTSVNLKNRFAGYKVELIVKYDFINDMINLVKEKLPGATQKSEPTEIEGGGVLLAYSLAPDRHEEVVPFFEVIEKDEAVADMILDYSISQTTLEEVFLNVTLNELFKDSSYRPMFMRSGSYIASPTTGPHVPIPSELNSVPTDLKT